MAPLNCRDCSQGEGSGTKEKKHGREKGRRHGTVVEVCSVHLYSCTVAVLRPVSDPVISMLRERMRLPSESQ